MKADLAAAWPADVRDACGNFFGTCLRACRPPLPADAAALEIGCAEFDWLSRAHQAWPAMSLTGIDWRAGKSRPGVTVLQGDVLRADAFAAAQFDWIVGVSSIEHVGLGHYSQDPLAEDGDRQCMRNIWHWLKPSGWVSLDVPWSPGVDQYEVFGTSHRRYDDATLASRLLMGSRFTARWRGAAHLTATHQLVDPVPFGPSEPHRFYLLGLWLQRAD